MTSIEWLDEQLQDNMHIQYGYSDGVRKIVIPIDEYMRLKKEALELEKEQITDAYDLGSLSEMQYPNPKTVIENGEQYYNKTYGSKGSDATSSQTEISDEEIEKVAKEYVLYNDQKRAWVIEGMKLYREQFKK